MWFYIAGALVVVLISVYVIKPIVFKPNLKAKFQDKRIIITGASSGLGRELAYQLAKLKTKLVLAARSIDKLDEVARTCKQLGATNVVVVKTDVSVSDQCKALIDEAVKAYDGIDIVFANAGIGMSATLFGMKDHGPDLLNQVMQVDYFGAVYTAFWALPELRKSKGHIAVISSVFGKIPGKGVSGYSAAKHALHGFFDSLRIEEKRNRIKVTLVCPGYIPTPIHETSLSADGSSVGKQKPSLLFQYNEIATGKAATLTLEATAANEFQATFPLLTQVLVCLRSVAPVLADKLQGA